MEKFSKKAKINHTFLGRLAFGEEGEETQRFKSHLRNRIWNKNKDIL